MVYRYRIKHVAVESEFQLDLLDEAKLKSFIESLEEKGSLQKLILRDKAIACFEYDLPEGIKKRGSISESETRSPLQE